MREDALLNRRLATVLGWSALASLAVLAGGVAHFGVAEPDVAPACDAEAEEEVRAG